VGDAVVAADVDGAAEPVSVTDTDADADAATVADDVAVGTGDEDGLSAALPDALTTVELEVPDTDACEALGVPLAEAIAVLDCVGRTDPDCTLDDDKVADTVALADDATDTVAVIDALDDEDEHTDADAQADNEPTMADGVAAVEAVVVADGDPPIEALVTAVAVSSAEARDDTTAEGDVVDATEVDAVAMTLGEYADEDEASGVEDEAPDALGAADTEKVPVALSEEAALGVCVVVSVATPVAVTSVDAVGARGEPDAEPV